MSQAIPLDEIEEQSARSPFLRLRRAVGLPEGGEIVLREEVDEVAKHLGVYDPSWTKARLVYELVGRYHYDWHDSDRHSWERTQKPNYARSYHYIQSREAESLAAAAEEVNRFQWGEA